MALPINTTYNAPIAVCSVFGRVFYASKGTVLFSRVIENKEQVGLCYQENDPTSEELSDLLDSDGGVIQLDGANNITHLEPFRTGVLAFADNGVWYIYGSTNVFTATGFATSKITAFGTKWSKAVVRVGDKVMYLHDSAIIAIVANEFDNVVANPVTDNTIRTYYVDTFTPDLNHTQVYGFFEERKNRIWWGTVTGDDDNNAIVLDLNAEAFYPQVIRGRAITAGVGLNTDVNTVFLNTVPDSSTEFNFAQLEDRTFKDFGVDQVAFLEGGPEHLGQFSNKKGATSIVTHLQRTETMVYDDVGSDGYYYDYPSSCLFSVIADNSTYANYKTKQNQMYRLNRRTWLPEDLPSELTDQADDIVVVKDKIRASGTNFRFRFDTEPEKDMQLLGYSVEFSMRGRQ